MIEQLFEQLKVVLLVYRQRWQKIILRLGGTTLLSFLAGLAMGRASRPPQRTWSAAIASHPGRPLSAFLLISAFVVFVFTLMMGSVLKKQMVSWRSRLLPNFAAAHFIVALGLGAFATLALVATAMVLGLSAQAQWMGMSVSAVVAGLVVGAWSFALLLFVGLYFLSPTAIVLLFFLAVFFAGPLVAPIFTHGHYPAIVAVLAVLNVAVVLILGRRMIHVDEEMPEYRLSLVGPRGAQQPIDSSSRTFKKASMRANAAFDELPEHLGDDFLSQARHFRRGFGDGKGYLLRSTLFWVGILWLLYYSGHFFRSRGPEELLFGLAIGSSLGAFLLNPKGSFRSVLMMPFRREELLKRYGVAVLMQEIRGWLSFALPIYIATWMPFPGTIHALPSMSHYVAPFLIQFPIFGAVTLLLSVQSSKPVVGLAILLSLVTVAYVDAGNHGLLLITMTSVLISVGLIAWAYRRWLQFEFN